jgi:hypothetical protein
MNHHVSVIWPFVLDLDATAVGMPPATVRFDTGGRNVKDALPPPYDDCDIPCHSSGSSSLVAKRTMDGTNWSFTVSWKVPGTYTGHWSCTARTK